MARLFRQCSSLFWCPVGSAITCEANKSFADKAATFRRRSRPEDWQPLARRRRTTRGAPLQVSAGPGTGRGSRPRLGLSSRRRALPRTRRTCGWRPTTPALAPPGTRFKFNQQRGPGQLPGPTRSRAGSSPTDPGPDRPGPHRPRAGPDPERPDATRATRRPRPSRTGCRSRPPAPA